MLLNTRRSSLVDMRLVNAFFAYAPVVRVIADDFLPSFPAVEFIWSTPQDCVQSSC